MLKATILALLVMAGSAHADEYKPRIVKPGEFGGMVMVPQNYTVVAVRNVNHLIHIGQRPLPRPDPRR